MTSHYLTKHTLFQIMQRNKLTYCSFLDTADTMLSHWPEGRWKLAIVAENDDFQAWIDQHGHAGMVVRRMTYQHIPTLDVPRRSNRAARPEYPALSFPPFKHYRLEARGTSAQHGHDDVDAKLGAGLVAREVLRSHWRGGIENGQFDAHAGRLDADFGNAVMLMTDKVARKSNYAGYSYRDEMVADAVLLMMEAGLKFDESKSDNPFAYWQQCIENHFKRRLNAEKRARDTRDDMLLMMGAAASSTRETDGWCEDRGIGWTVLADHQKRYRRGRPKKRADAH